MSLLQPLALGILQGLTEFLPVSSSGHLIAVPSILGWNLQTLAFDVTVHLGTLAALIVFFFTDLWKIGIAFFQDVWNKEDKFLEYSENGKMGLYILLGSVPAGILGYFFREKIVEDARSVLNVAIFLIVGSFLMLAAEKFSQWKKDKDLNLRGALIIGFFQALALLPGMSRSGSTISGGMLFGLNRKKSARFSFLLSIPVVAFAGLYELYSTIRFTNQQFELLPFVVGFVSSFIVGIFAIRFLLNLLQNRGLYVFIVYRIILALFILVMVL